MKRGLLGVALVLFMMSTASFEWVIDKRVRKLEGKIDGGAILTVSNTTDHTVTISIPSAR